MPGDKELHSTKDDGPAASVVSVPAGPARAAGFGGGVQALGQGMGVVMAVMLVLAARLWTALPYPLNITAGVGFGVGALLFLPGLWLALKRTPPGKTLLTGGMAFIFLSIAEVVLNPAPGALPAMLAARPSTGFFLCACMLSVFGWLGYRASSPTACLLTVLMGAFLPELGGLRVAPTVHVLYIGAFSAFLLVLVGAWLQRRQGLLFPFAAMLVFHGALPTAAQGALRLGVAGFAAATLSLFFVYGGLTFLATQNARRSNALMTGFALANTVGFILTFLRFSEATEAPMWLLPTVLIAVGMGTVLLMPSHDMRNTLGAIFLCQALLSLLFLILLYTPPGMNLVLVALLGLLPAIAGEVYGGRAFRIAEYGLLTVFMAATFLVPLPARTVLAGPAAIPPAWMYLLGAGAVLGLLAQLHATWATPQGHLPHEPRDDGENAHLLLSVTHLCCLALMLALHTILRRNDSETLPLLLGLQGLLFLGVGLIALMPRVALAGLIPVMAGHASYYGVTYLLPFTEWAVPEINPSHIAVLSGATLVLALLCDWHLGQGAEKKPLRAERLMAMLPYLAIPATLWTVLLDAPSFMRLAVLLASFGLGTALLERLAGDSSMPGLYTLGRAAVPFSAAVFLHGLLTDAGAVFARNEALPLLALYVVFLLLCLRVLAWRRFAAGRGETWKMQVCCLFIALLGALGLYQWNGGPLFALSLAGLALLVALTGYALRFRACFNTVLVLLFLAAAWMLFAGWGGILPSWMGGALQGNVRYFPGAMS